MDPATSPPPRSVTVYEPSTHLPPIGPYVRGILARRPFIWHLSLSALKAEHYNTVLGQVWLILNPILLALTYLLVRSILRPIGSGEERAMLLDYLIMAVFFFRYTQGSLTSGAKSILSNRQLIMNTSFPRAVFPLQAVLKELLDFLPMLAVLFVLHGLLGQPFGLSLLWLPIIIGIQTVFNLGLALIFAPLTAAFRDTQNILQFISRLWLFASPIFYRVDEIPPGLLPYLRLNPLFPLYAMLERVWQAQAPLLTDVLWFAGWAVGALAVGCVLFLRKEREFAVLIER